MKRGTTPTLPIKIKMPFDNVKRIEFIFKRDFEYANTLLYKIYEENIPAKKGENEFVVDIKFTAEETMRLQGGEVYMDTRITLVGGFIPETQIVKININETLFREVYRSD